MPERGRKETRGGRTARQWCRSGAAKPAGALARGGCGMGGRGNEKRPHGDRRGVLEHLGNVALEACSYGIYNKQIIPHK